MKTIASIGNAAAYGMLTFGFVSSLFGQTYQPQPASSAGVEAINSGQGAPLSSPPIVTAAAYQNIGGVDVPPTPDYTNGIYQQPWFANRAIREQLSISDREFAQLSAAYEQAWSRYNLGVTEANVSLNEAQTTQYQQYLFGVMNKNLGQAIDTLVPPASRQRFNQLSLQYRSYGAFSDPNVQQQLNLSSYQIQSFFELDQAWNQLLSQWYEDFPNRPIIVTRAFYSVRGSFGDDVESILSEVQQEIWQSLVGEPFNFGPNDYFQYETLPYQSEDVDSFASQARQPSQQSMNGEQSDFGSNGDFQNEGPGFPVGE